MEYLKLWFDWHKAKIAVVAVIFLALTLGFGMGVAAGQEGNHAPIVIQKCSANS